MNKTTPNSQCLSSPEDCINACKEIFELGIRSDCQEALDRYAKWSKTNIYYASHELLLNLLLSMLSGEKDDIELTYDHAERLLAMCDQFKRPSSIASKLMSFITRTNYDDYTDAGILKNSEKLQRYLGIRSIYDRIYLDEVHAINIKSITLSIYGLQTLVIDQNLMSLVKAALKFQESYMMFKECQTIAETRTKWSTDTSRLYFEHTLGLTQSYQSIILSHLPERVIRFFTWFGFDCDRTHALHDIEVLCERGQGVSAVLAKFALGGYELLLVPLFGARQAEVTFIMTFVESELLEYPKSSWALLYKALALKLSGDFDSAIDHYKRCIESQPTLKPLHNICHWDLSFCYGFKMDWASAAKHAESLIDHCNWSRATFTYMKASFLYMKMIADNEPELKTEIAQLMKQVPKLKQRFAGKTIPPEKYVCVKAEKYFAQNQSSPLPAFDLFYIWNVYILTANNPKLLDPIIDQINNTLPAYLRKFDELENTCLLILIKGICYKYQGKNELAENCFKEVLKNEESLEHSPNLPPMAALEMGLTKLNAGSYSEAEGWLKRAQKYRKYSFKSMIHFRVHSALQRVRQGLDENANKS